MHFTHGFSIKPCPAGIMAVQGEERGERREGREEWRKGRGRDGVRVDVPSYHFAAPLRHIACRRFSSYFFVFMQRCNMLGVSEWHHRFLHWHWRASIGIMTTGQQRCPR